MIFIPQKTVHIYHMCILCVYYTYDFIIFHMCLLCIYYSIYIYIIIIIYILYIYHYISYLLYMAPPLPIWAGGWTIQLLNRPGMVQGCEEACVWLKLSKNPPLSTIIHHYQPLLTIINPLSVISNSFHSIQTWCLKYPYLETKPNVLNLLSWILACPCKQKIICSCVVQLVCFCKGGQRPHES